MTGVLDRAAVRRATGRTWTTTARSSPVEWCSVLARDSSLSSGAERWGIVGGGLLGVGGDQGEAGLGEDVEAEGAAGFGPFVVLFGGGRARGAGQGGAGGGEPADGGAAGGLAGWGVPGG